MRRTGHQRKVRGGFRVHWERWVETFQGPRELSVRMDGGDAAGWIFRQG